MNVPQIRACSIGVLLAAGLLWPAQGHAKCSLLANTMEQALCDAESNALLQQTEVERLNNRIKEMEAAQSAAEWWRVTEERERQSLAKVFGSPPAEIGATK